MSTEIVYDGSNDHVCNNSLYITRDSGLYRVTKFGKPVGSCRDIEIFPNFVALFMSNTVIFYLKKNDKISGSLPTDHAKECFVEYDEHIYVFMKIGMCKIPVSYNWYNESYEQVSNIVINHDNIIMQLVKFLPEYDQSKLRNLEYIGSVKRKKREPYNIPRKLFDTIIIFE